MNLNAFAKTVGETVVKTTSKAVFACKKKSPQILLVAGIAGVAVGVGLAAYNTYKKSADIKEKADSIKEVKAEKPDYPTEEATAEEVTEKVEAHVDYTKSLCKAYGELGLELAKTYAVPVIITGVSVAAICVSHNILTGRVTGMATALAGVTAAHNNYRKRVAAVVGEEVEEKIYTGQGITKGDITGIAEDFDKPIEETFGDSCEPVYAQAWFTADYTKEFPNFNNGRSNEFAFDKLARIEQDCNRELLVKGYLYLNDVRKRLGYGPTIEGYQLGWLAETDRKDIPTEVHFNPELVQTGFTYEEDLDPNESKHINGAILLHFNVRGQITEDLPIDRI